MIGKEEGAEVISSTGERFHVFRPGLSEFVLEMPRKGQIIYPKDIAVIVMWADIFPGARVIEGGIGSGALTMALLRAVGQEGMVVSYEVREDFARQALFNIESFLGKVENLKVKLKDIYQGIDEKDFDRVVLDVPEPWRVVPHLNSALRKGGFFLSYLPTIIQVKKLVDTMRESGIFARIEIIEVLMRPWNVEGMSVRPVHRMVAHTGFMVVGRKV
ncbi:tRNA (adenine-N1)-methyltransferase [Candidatus Aerophobetes bacterium]|nr:tRNA (adenine-N1)-methyltransferase [Candidatus Aerophobetes bacterium]